MNIVLTGVTGFLGARLLLKLIQTGHSVIALKRSSSIVAESLAHHPNVHWIDLDSGPISELFSPFQSIDLLIHCATDYGRKQDLFLAPFFVNVDLPIQLIDVLMRKGCDRIINSDSFYSAMPDYDYLRSYILSKRQFLDWGRYLAEEKLIHFVNMRIFHMYGPGDSNHKFVNRLVHQCQVEVGDINLTSGEQKRDFIHVDDVVSAFSKVINKPVDDVRFEHHEVGTGRAISIYDFATMVHRLTLSRASLCFGVLPTRQGEPREIVAMPESLNNLGWNANITLEQGVQSIIEINDTVCK